MKVELGLLTFAFLGGMVVQDTMSPDQIVWKDYGENPMANPQFMQDWAASMTPGAPHAELAKQTGKWDVASKMWMDPAGAPMDSKGESTSRMVLGGRYLLEEYKSEFMGMPYEGMMLQGYDNLTQEYVTIWLDNMSTGPYLSTGQVDANGKMVSRGVMRDVSTPAGRPSHFEVTPKSENSHLFEMFDQLPDGTKYKSFEMTYTRRGAK